MKKNVASQAIGVQLTNAADGTAFTGTATVVVTVDGGTQSASGGTGPTHEGNGFHTYLPTQAETNGDHIGFTFTGSGAITTTVQIYTVFPQTGDTYALAAGAAGFSAIDAVVDSILADTADMQPNYATSAALATAQTDLDTITGADGVNLLSATQASIDAIETDTSTTLQGELDAIQAAVITNAAGTDIAADIIAIKAETATIVADTNELQTDDIPGLIAGLNDPTASAIADAVWDELMAGHVTVDTAGLVMNELQNGGRLDSILDIIAADTTTDIPALIATAQADLDLLTGSDGATLATAQGNYAPAKQADIATELATYDGPTNAEMEARTPTAAQLAYIVANAATGMPVVFTTSGGATTTAVLNTVDGSAASTTNDQYNGRLLVFTDGTLAGVVTDITDYVGATKTATITAIPFAPTSSHNARLI